MTIDLPSTKSVRRSLASSDWKPVVGYEGVFEVSRCGKVRRIKSAKGAQLRERKLTLDPSGYLVTSLWHKNKGKTLCVHRLVAMAWVKGNHSLSVNHKDGNKLNNHADNLEWISLADNTRHQNQTGLSNKVACYKPSKIMPIEYPSIIERLNKGEMQKTIAEEYNCSQPLISWIKKKHGL